MSDSPNDNYFPGLEGVIAGETSITNLQGVEGQGDLEYRGYRIEDLAGTVTYEESVYLLLYGELPNATQLEALKGRLAARRAIPEPLVDLYRAIPASVHAMDVLRTSVSVLAHFDDDVNAPPNDHEANIRKAESLIARMPTAIAARERIVTGQEPVAPREDLDHAANFLAMVNGQEPSAAKAQAFDLSLVVYAEHEYNASTFSCRVAVSTLSDIYSGVTAAIGTLKGPLHGGANEAAWNVLVEVGDPARAESWIHDALEQKKRIMGFGHRVYKTGDPRARVIKPHCQRIAHEIGQTKWEDIAQTIESAVVDQKGLLPNVDWPTARLYHYLGLRTEIYTPIFAMGRAAGWSAHINEQLQHNRLMRPRARYNGVPNRKVVPLQDRV